MKGIEETLTMTSIKEVVKLMYGLFTSEPSSKWRLTIKPWTKKRGLSMNAQQHVWYDQIAKAQGDKSAIDVKNMCKDMFGLPILCNSSTYGDTINFLLAKLDYYKHSYESKMKLIQCLSVTAEFTTAESKEYCEQMIYFFNDLGVPIKYKD